jgi:hypothetical protein
MVATSPPAIPKEELDALLEKSGITGDEYYMFAEVRALNAALDQTALGETIIARYRQEMADVANELRPETIPEAERPRVLGLGASPGDWSNIHTGSGDDPFLATRSAARKNLRVSGRFNEAERVLAMDPDIIMGNPLEMGADIRWRGMRAVREHHVYGGNYALGGYIHDIDNLPLSARWKAEIFHPTRMSATIREKIRAHYREAYGFEMNDAQIDILLRVEENAGAVGYERFLARDSAYMDRGEP